MTMRLSGPMFEAADSGPWKSLYGKDGAHYNCYGISHANERAHGMAALREFFPDGKADSMNVCLFSTSGVHGTYTTIEEAEAAVARGDKDEDGEEFTPSVTFLVVQPRIVCTRHGNCYPRTADDFAFLKTLRQTSWDALAEIGKAE
jgi:hypothetical protein